MADPIDLEALRRLCDERQRILGRPVTSLPGFAEAELKLREVEAPLLDALPALLDRLEALKAKDALLSASLRQADERADALLSELAALREARDTLHQAIRCALGLLPPPRDSSPAKVLRDVLTETATEYEPAALGGGQ